MASEQQPAKADELQQEIKGNEPCRVERGRVTIEVLSRIGQGMPTPELLKDVVNLLADRTGFEAVGLRLKEGDDYPYFQTRGMSEEFILLENSLCPQRNERRAEPGDNGDITLECACGSVIQGRIDRSQSFFSEYGSFWSSSNARLLVEYPNLKDSIRGNCVRSGYESSALIPLRIGNETFGLLQFEDKRPGMLSHELLSSLESIAVSLALALSQRQYAEKLRKEKEALESFNQDLQEFSVIASHDLQEPLRKIRSFGDRLARKYKDALGEDGQDYLNRMTGAAKRMHELLEGLLKYSRVTTQANPLNSTDLNKVVEDTISDLEISIKAKGAGIEVGDLPIIQADEPQMRQLFQNLISNSIKYQPEGGRPQIKIYSRVEGKATSICVEDNGIGFEEECAETIFKPFQRLHGRQSIYDGTGMGLAICKKIVQRHGGRITAKSSPGEGSLFVIELPARQAG
jgi:signal transduction histidine kinase